MEEEDKLRKALRTGKLKPMPPGVLVTGRMGVTISPRQVTCEGHVWETKKAKRNPYWQSGWVQGARCVNCDMDIPPLDASWWMERASPKRVRLAMRMCKEEAQRQREVHTYLRRKLRQMREESE